MMAAMLQPVFWDPTGRRPYRVAYVAITVALLIAAIGVFEWRSVLAPLDEPELHGETDYPRAALTIERGKTMPVIGDTKAGILNRVVQVDCRKDVTYLTDPYTAEVIRTATDVDLEQIGSHSYVVDYFGKPMANKQLMLTFDDGPDARFTPQILDVLAREGVAATFFVLGESVTKNPEVLQRIIREGHMVGNHTMTHHDFDEQSNWRNRSELLLASRLIRAAGHYDTHLFRIPKADPDNNSLALLQAQQQGLVHVNLDVDTLDWSYKPGEAVPVPQLDGRGHVVLMHDSGGDRTETVRALQTLISHAKAQGYTFSTVQPLLPKQYVPQKNITPTHADRVTLWTFQGMWVLPGALLSTLFWIGMGSLVIMSLLYLLLAVVFQFRQRKADWSGVRESDLPRVSVVLAAYNEAKVIKRTLDALKVSVYPLDRLEVIVVDDGSTDTTLQIVTEYAARWPQLKVISQTNGGKAQAINNGINHTDPLSTVIVTLDADTIFCPDTVSKLARHFVPGVHRGTMGVVAGHIKVGNRRNILTAWQSLEYISGICVTRTAEGLMGAISIVPGACSAWSRDALVQIGGLSNITLAEDADATLKLQQLRYIVGQENSAIAFTEAPETIRTLATQRKRWMFGILQALWMHRAMMLRPRYGMLGLISLPYAALSLLVPLLFFPLTVAVAGVNLVGGNWRSVVLFAACVAGMHMVMSVVALVIAREKPWHLLIVPIYRIIYEPLRAYLLYVSVYRVIRGRVVGWNKLERTNNVAVQRVPQP